MTQEQIETRIAFIQEKLAAATHPQDLQALNRTLERLLAMEPSADKPRKE